MPELPEELFLESIRQLVAELEQVREVLRELRPSPLGSEPADEPPPPHY